MELEVKDNLLKDITDTYRANGNAMFNINNLFNSFLKINRADYDHKTHEASVYYDQGALPNFPNADDVAKDFCTLVCYVSSLIADGWITFIQKSNDDNGGMKGSFFHDCTLCVEKRVIAQQYVDILDKYLTGSAQFTDKMVSELNQLNVLGNQKNAIADFLAKLDVQKMN